MRRNSHYRQLILFVVVLILPSILVTMQGWRIVTLDHKNRVQDAQKSETDARNRARTEIGRDVLTRLQNITVQEIGDSALVPLIGLDWEGPDTLAQDTRPAVKFIGWAYGDRLVMPWEEGDPNSEPFRRAIEEPDFARKVEYGEAAEFVDKLPERAVTLYRDLIRTASNEHQRVFAHLMLARVLRSSGARTDAETIYRDLLNLPSNVVDRDGLSFASIAAGALAESASREVLARITRDVASPATLTLRQAYRWRSVLEAVRDANKTALREDAKRTLESLSFRITSAEKAQKDLENDPEFRQLRKDFPGLGLSEKSWQPYGRDLLLSRVHANAAFRPLVIAVRRDMIFEAVRTSRNDGPKFTFLVGDDSGESLDERHLPGLKISFADNGATNMSEDLRRSFYATWILLVVSLNLFGGYLLWRDTRRELRVAELRSQFVSSVSHELKTPLTAIRMFAEILQTKDSVDPEAHTECVDTIVNESERLTRLLNNVLDFSRLEHGQKTYRKEPTRLSEVVAAAVKTMQYPLAEQGFDLRMELDDRIPPVPADRDALKQAVLNLLTNAMKYSGQSRDIELRLFPQNGDVLIQVSDHGIGIPTREQSRIFEKFYRAHVPENHAISGTGLGLALVAHIVEGHGGSVGVESSPGAGSTFSIRIPLHAGAAS